MKNTIAVLLSALLILSVSTPLLAKERTVKITISGAGLKTPFITRSIAAVPPVMCICPVNPMNCSSEMCVQFSAELKVTGFARGTFGRE